VRTGGLPVVVLVEVSHIPDEGQRNAPRRGGGFLFLLDFRLRTDVGFLLLGFGRIPLGFGRPLPGRGRTVGGHVTPGWARLPGRGGGAGTILRPVLVTPRRGARPTGRSRLPGAPLGTRGGGARTGATP